MTAALADRSRPALISWLSSWMAEEMGLEAGSVDPSRPFLAYGLNSIQAMMLVGDLETGLGRSLPPTLAWDHPSIEALAEHLAAAPGAPAPEAPRPAPSAAGPDVRDLLSRIDELPEDQVDALLRQYLS